MKNPLFKFVMAVLVLLFIIWLSTIPNCMDKITPSSPGDEEYVPAENYQGAMD